VTERRLWSRLARFQGGHSLGAAIRQKSISFEGCVLARGGRRLENENSVPLRQLS